MRIPRKARFENASTCLILCAFLLKIADSMFMVVKLSWPKTLVKKWFNIKSKADEFQADDVVYGGDYWFLSSFGFGNLWQFITKNRNGIFIFAKLLLLTLSQHSHPRAHR